MRMQELNESNDKKKQKISPLGLFYSRFFESHKSFYDLEILNKSVINSYIVVLDSQVY